MPPHHLTAGERQVLVDEYYGNWARQTDSCIGGLYGTGPHRLRGSDPHLVRKPLLPRGGYGPRTEPGIAALRQLVHFGEKYLAERAQGQHRQANRTWLRAVRLAPKPAAPSLAEHRSAARLWPCLATSAAREQLSRWRGLFAKADDSILQRRWSGWDG